MWIDEEPIFCVGVAVRMGLYWVSFVYFAYFGQKSTCNGKSVL